ncbi:MAG: NAD-dependent epimerase/dehydratase family protein [Lapillicoccus sp.]
MVTGASGRLGGRLVQRLVADGHDVRGLARSAAAEAAVAGTGAAPVRGSLTDPASLDTAVGGCEVVVHCAGVVGSSSRRQPYAVNISGTENVIAAARAGGVSRLVHVGAAMSLLGGRRPILDADESWPINEPGFSGYAASKTVAERAVHAASSPSLSTVVIRPGWVWGDLADPQAEATADAVRVGRMRLIDGGGHRIVTSHIDNTVGALCQALDHGRPGGSYFVFDEGTVTLADFLSQLMGTYGLTLPRASMPGPLAGVLARAMDLGWRVARRPGDPPVSRLLVALNAGPFVVSDALARQELGYRPAISRAEGMTALYEARRSQSEPQGRSAAPA